jgi:hypothetical protein
MSVAVPQIDSFIGAQENEAGVTVWEIGSTADAGLG